jgi:hypothetical protein
MNNHVKLGDLKIGDRALLPSIQLNSDVSWWCDRPFTIVSRKDGLVGIQWNDTGHYASPSASRLVDCISDREVIVTEAVDA